MFKYNNSNIKGKIKHSKELFLRCNNCFIALMKTKQITIILINPLIGIKAKEVEMITCNYYFYCWRNYPNDTSNIIIIMKPNVNQSVEAVLCVLLDSGISSLTHVAIIAPAEKLNKNGNIELI